MKVTTIKSARAGATTVHMGEDIGWSSRPFCPALATGRREVDPHAEGTVNCRPCIKEANARYLDVNHLIQISSRIRNLIKAVREHAVANYNTGAWDIIVEAYTDPELAETVRGCRTAAGAIAKVAKVVELYRERRAPHDAEIAAATETTVFSDPAQPEVGEYDRYAEGSHPDGSVVRWRYSEESGDSWGRRVWPGKLGEGNMEWCDREDGGYVLVEVYTPGWRGVNIESANYCTHSAPQDEICWSPSCRRTSCCPF